MLRKSIDQHIRQFNKDRVPAWYPRRKGRMLTFSRCFPDASERTRASTPLGMSVSELSLVDLHSLARQRWVGEREMAERTWSVRRLRKMIKSGSNDLICIRRHQFVNNFLQSEVSTERNRLAVHSLTSTLAPVHGRGDDHIPPTQKVTNH